MKKTDMSRMLTREEVKERILHDIPCTDYLERARNHGYVCIYCGSGKGEHGTGAVKYYKETNTCACFACADSGKGRKFDVLDLIQHYEHCDYNTALQMGADKLGLTIYDDGERIDSGWKSHTVGRNSHDSAQAPQRAENKEGKEAPATAEKGSQEDTAPAPAVDFTDYYMECMQRFDDSPAPSFLQARGISQDTAEAYKLGYDPAGDPANAPGATADTHKPHPEKRLIIPCGKDFYIARSINPKTPATFKAPNPKGCKPKYFNGKEVKKPGPLFVTEGAIDALSVIEAGSRAMALNSTNQAGNFIKSVKRHKDTIQCTFIICMDNDDPGRKAARAIEKGLQEAGVKYMTANIAGDHKDPNDALIADRQAFERAIKEAIKEASELPDPQQDADQGGRELPGLLLYDDIVKEFQEADDDIIEICQFPEFSKTAKIKKHSTIVIAADTGGGKSSLAINFLNALNAKYPCLLFNLEMDKISVLRRIVAIQSGLELDRIEGYKNDPNTAQAVNIFLRAITERQPLQVIQDIYLLEQIEKIIKESTEGREKPTMVFIDHSLLVEVNARVSGRYERFTIISEQLRKIALRYNIVLFVLLQQSRAGKADEEEKPKNSSLKESGSWENDATHICFLWFDPKMKRKKLLLTKNRGGDQGEFLLNYWKKTQTYTEAKGQGAATSASAGTAPRITKRDKARGKLQDAYDLAVITTNGHPTIRAMAEAADVTTATIKGWLKEYGGCTIDGIPVDPAGIDTEVEYTGFVKVTAEDDNPYIDAEERDSLPAMGAEIAKKFKGRKK